MSKDAIEYLSDLNEILFKHELEANFQFIYTEYPGGFIFDLQEIHDTGQEFEVFNSEDLLPNDIEDKYENDEITYKEVLFKTIKTNIGVHITNLTKISNLL